MTMFAVQLIPVALVFAAPIPAAFAHGERSSQQATDSVTYERLLEQLRAIERSEMESPEAQDGRNDFVLTGVADEATQRWLAAARPLARQLARVAPPTRELDYSQGFALLLPHLSDMRFLQKQMRFLAHDAAFRGDRALVGELLRAQVVTARNAGEDRILISSLVSLGISHFHATAVDEFIELGEVDQATAKSLLESREGLEESTWTQVLAAIGTEADIAVQEAGKFTELGDMARRAQLDGLGLPNAGEIDLTAADKWNEQAAAYRDAVQQAIANPDRAAATAAIAALQARVEQGEFGDLLKALGPALSSIVRRFDMFAATFAAQDALLADIASGAKKPADLLNAARHYRIAARAAETLSVERQRTIDALRVAPEGLTEADRREARRTVEGLRAQVIDQIMQASRIKRCVFSDVQFRPYGEPHLASEEYDGALGALRIALFDPSLPGERPAGAPTAVDACVAALAAVRHFASDGGIGHALVAQRFARDIAAAVAQLDARGQLDATARERIGAEVARLNPTDPFGLRGAVDFERRRIAGMRQARFSTKSEGTRFGRDRLANLSPDVVAFLVGVLSTATPALSAEPCACAFDGPVLDLRGMFDVAALKAAQEQRQKLEERFEAVVLRGEADSGSALEGLTVTKPVDMEARFAEATADFERLQAFTRVEPQAGNAAPQPPSKGLVAQNARMPKPGPEGPAVEVYMEALAGEDGSYRSKRGHDGVGELLELVDRLDKDEEALARAKTLIAPIMPDIATLRTIRERPVFGVSFVAGPLTDARLARFLDVAEAETRTDLLTNTLLRAQRPGNSMLMRASELMLASAAVALREQRTGDFLVDIETVRMVARHFGEGEDWLAAIGRDFVETEICRAICGAVSSQAEHFTEEQLAVLSAAIPVRGDALLRAIEFERRKIDEIAELCFADDGSGDGVPRDPAFDTVFGPARDGPITLAGQDTDWEAKPIGRRAYLAAARGLLDRVLAAARAPSADNALTLSRELDERYGDTLSKDRAEIEVADLLGFDASVQASALVRLLPGENPAQAARAVIAIVRFERARGRYPADLAELGELMGETLGSWAAEGGRWRFAAGSASARLEVPWYGADECLQFSVRPTSRR